MKQINDISVSFDEFFGLKFHGDQTRQISNIDGQIQVTPQNHCVLSLWRCLTNFWLDGDKKLDDRRLQDCHCYEQKHQVIFDLCFSTSLLKTAMAAKTL